MAALGRGFLGHRDNGALRDALSSGALSVAEYLDQLLWLVFRLATIRVAEARGLVHPHAADDAARWAYAEGFSLGRFAAVGADAPEDAEAWSRVRRVVRGLSRGDAELGLPALGGLFAGGPAALLEGAALGAAALGEACRHLGSGAALGALPPEQLGAAYEEMLGRLPEVSVESARFGFAEGEAGKGTARKSSGSYYTPDTLVQALLDSALDPVLDGAGALLDVRVLDPACGTGNFLLAAARRLADRLAPAGDAAARRAALGQVVDRCIYGVDLDPLAVELCRVALWLEVGEAGRPLAPPGSNLRVGNALLGATPRRVARGIPDSAWQADNPGERARLRALRARDGRESGGQPMLSGNPGGLERADARDVCDAWCAAFVWPRGDAAELEAAPTSAAWSALRAGRASPDTLAIVRRVRRAHRFFHWHLEFPEVAARGGFDVVVGNPPYLNQLEADTAVGAGVRRLLAACFGDLKQPYTDLATLFLVLAQSLLRPGGRQALVHPISLFAACDADPARRHLAAESAVTHVWLTPDRLFPAASVLVCAVTLERGGDRACRATRTCGNQFAPAEAVPVDMDALAAAPTWGELIADLVGVPRAPLRNPRCLGDLARVTGDFRDQFYGLLPFVVEDAPGMTDTSHPPLVITGLIDPAVCLWGARACKFGKKPWTRPRVDLAALRAEGGLAPWATARLVPKIVVATQSRVIEAFADPKGRVINTVPTLTLTPNHPDDLWRLLAVLLAPPVCAWAAGRYAGTALSIQAIKLSAEQAMQIPLPTVDAPWRAATALVQAASEAGNPAAREALLLEAGALLCDAYEVPRAPVWGWWRDRLTSHATLAEGE